MALSPGTRLGRYEIRSLVGAGGMGEVYLAQDTKLGRRVALKVLPAGVASDERRTQRFVQEAQAASALNHPNIITIHEIEEIDSTLYIATEFIEGETLRQRAARARLTIPESLDVAIQIASALSAAHEAGIVHRDIKPENVMLRRDGIVKVLDFGLAKLAELQPSGVDTEAPTKAIVNTEPGTVMGTAAYMSPEQARGLETDARTDIWSLGCVLYETVTGRRPFEGETATDVIAAIIKGQPAPLARHNADAPPKLEEIVSKALEKDREERYQGVRDLLVDLRRLKKRVEFEAEAGRSVSPVSAETRTSAPDGSPHASQLTQAAAPTGASQPARPTSSAEYIVTGFARHKRAALAGLVALAAVAAAAAYGFYRLAGSKKQAARFERIKVEKLTTLGNVDQVAISPDGKFISYTLTEGDRRSLWTKYLPTGSTVEIVAPAKVKGLGIGSFSPDGNFLYYGVWDDENPNLSLFQTPSLGGAKKKIMEGVETSISFSPDGRRFAFGHTDLATTNDELRVADANGGNVKTLASKSEPKGEAFTAGPAWSPDGKLVATGAVSTVGGTKATVVGVDVATGEIKRLTSYDWSGLSQIAWLNDGSGLVVSGSRLVEPGVQLWLLSLPGGEVRRITNGLDLNGYLSASVTADGRSIASTSIESEADIWLAPSNAPDRAHARRVTTHGQQLNGTGGVAWAADGRLVYCSFASGNGDIWITKADGTEQKQLTDDPHADGIPLVTPDGRTVVFNSMRSGNDNLWRVNLDGGDLRQLTSGKVDTSAALTPDGRFVIYASIDGDQFALLKVPVDGGAPVRVATMKYLVGLCVSPDGKLLAYLDLVQENGKFGGYKIVVMPVEGGAPVKSFQIPLGAGHLVWTPDGRAIIYIAPQIQGGVNYLWRQPIDGGAPTVLADFSPESVFYFAFSPDGKQLALSLGHTTQDAVLITEEK